ncbi:MAG: protein TolR [Gammaproteobacteria bacterium]
MSEINVVPYIDVMLVLLVIFMVTAPLLQQGVEVALPEAPSKPLEEGSRDNEPLVVTVDAEGRMSMNKGQTPNEPLDADLLTTEVRGLLIEQPTLPVYVRGDRNVAYDYVIQALVVLQSAGADGVGLITDPPPKQRGGG